MIVKFLAYYLDNDEHKKILDSPTEEYESYRPISFKKINPKSIK